MHHPQNYRFLVFFVVFVILSDIRWVLSRPTSGPSPGKIQEQQINRSIDQLINTST
jgi:hypothetical protein